MTISLPKVDINADKFEELYDKINAVIDTLDTKVVTADADTTNGNVSIGGRMIANEVYENGSRVINENYTISSGTGLSGGGNLSTNRTISLSSSTLARLAKADSALQTTDFTGKLGLKTKISVPDDILAAGTANSTTFLSGAGSWVKLENTPGDMLKMVYDPWQKAANAFDMASMVETNQHKILTAAERSRLDNLPGDLTYINGQIQYLKDEYVKRDGTLDITGGIFTKSIHMTGTLFTNSEIQTNGMASSAKVKVLSGGIEVVGDSSINGTLSVQQASTYLKDVNFNGNLTANVPNSGGRINIVPTPVTASMDKTLGNITSFHKNGIVSSALFGTSTGNTNNFGSGIYLTLKDTGGGDKEVRLRHFYRRLSSGAVNPNTSGLGIYFTPSNGWINFFDNGKIYTTSDVDANNIYARNDVGAASDIKLKENLEIIPDALEKLNKVNGYTYSRNDLATDKRFAGVIAQEIEKILPEAVGLEEESDTKYVNYGSLTSILIEAIKELSHKVRVLEDKLSKDN